MQKQRISFGCQYGTMRYVRLQALPSRHGNPKKELLFVTLAWVRNAIDNTHNHPRALRP